MTDPPARAHTGSQDAVLDFLGGKGCMRIDSVLQKRTERMIEMV
jgi:hypothetical protein